MTTKYEIGEVLEVSVEKIVPNGLGLCFAEDLTIFVPLSVRGDQLRVEIRQIKGKTAFAKIIGVLKPSDDRIEPPCEYFGICGGCDFQQMSYEAQLQSKVGILQDCLSRIGKIKFEDEIRIIPSPDQFGYRHRSQWHADTKSRTIGYFKRLSHDVVDVDSCAVLVPALEQKLRELRADLPWKSFFSDAVNIEASCDDGGKTSIYSEELTAPAEDLCIQVKSEKFFYNAQTFFQGNRFLLESLVDTAVGEFSGDTAIDLYAGVGLFSVFLGRQFENVYSVESNSKSVEFAKRNFDEAGLKNITVSKQRVKEFCTEDGLTVKNPDLLVLDPPRSGVKNTTLKLMTDLGANRISYVSCNPSTLARDMQELISRNYKIDRITAIDLFPQTHHVETVVHLSR